jgi:hypothetical protein
MTMPSLLSLSIIARQTDYLLWGALILFVVAGATHFWLTPEAAYQAEQAQRELARLQAEPAPGSREPNRSASALERFEAVMTPRAQISTILERNFALASEFKIELGRGEYRLDQDVDGGFHYYRLALPVTGPYVSLRSYIDAVLAEWPGIALEQVSFSRGHAGERETEAVLRFAMLVTE